MFSAGFSQNNKAEKRLEKVYIGAKNTVACFGNHDSWNGSDDPDYDEAVKLFLSYVGHNGIKSEKVYYSAVIKGYRLICPAPNIMTKPKTSATITAVWAWRWKYMPTE